MSYTPPTPGSTVEVLFEGKVIHSDAVSISFEGLGLLDWSESGRLVSCTTTVPAYTPQPGDVALWQLYPDKGSRQVMVTCCQVATARRGWYMSGVDALIQVEVDHTSDRFQLMTRDGKTVPAKPQVAPRPAPERQAVLDDYRPRLGDVGIFKSGSGTSVVVTYRVSGTYAHGPRAWMTADGRTMDDAHGDPTFQLVLRDGQLQEGVNV